MAGVTYLTLLSAAHIACFLGLGHLHSTTTADTMVLAFSISAGIHFYQSPLLDSFQDAMLQLLSMSPSRGTNTATAVLMALLASHSAKPHLFSMATSFL